MDSQELRDRTKEFSIQIIRFIQSLDDSFEKSIIAKQLLRSATSVASNYRAACRSRSKAEYYAKLCIVVEESDETQFWLELLLDSDLSNNQPTRGLYNEATEILKIFSSSRKSFKENNK